MTSSRQGISLGFPGVRRPSRRAAAQLAFRMLGAEPRFVIMSTGRTGSELLVSLLDAHPDISCQSEILERRRLLPAHLVLLQATKARFRGRAYGFKLLAHHAGLQDPADPARFLRSFHDRGFRIIVLERREWLHQAVSSIRAANTRLHDRKADHPKFSPIRIDPVAVVAALFLIEDGVTFLRSAMNDIPALHLIYEDDLEQPEQQQATVDRVCSYLGLESATVETDLVRITPRSLLDQLENFDELAAVLSTTRYRKLLPASVVPESR